MYIRQLGMSIDLHGRRPFQLPIWYWYIMVSLFFQQALFNIHRPKFRCMAEAILQGILSKFH